MSNDIAAQIATKCRKDCGRALGVFGFAAECRERHQICHHDCVGVGRGIVRAGAQPCNDVSGVIGGCGVAAVVRNPIVTVKYARPCHGLLKVMRVGGCFVQAQCPPDHVGVIIGRGRGFGATVAE